MGTGFETKGTAAECAGNHDFPDNVPAGVSGTKCGGLPRLFMRVTGGFSLVEILVYMVIFSVMSIGITTVIWQMQKSRITVTNLTADIGDAELALRSVRLKMGRADAVEIDNVSAGDRACLRLRRKAQIIRSGHHFDGDNQYVKSATTFPIVGASPRTVSAWVWYEPEDQGRATVVHWGTGTSARSQFGLSIDDGVVAINLGCVQYRAVGATIPTGQWVHLAVTYDGQELNLVPNSLKLYMNGGLQVMTKITLSSCVQHGSKLVTSVSFLFAGNDSDARGGLFDGHVSGVRIWNTALTQADITALYTAGGTDVTPQPGQQLLKWSLATDNGPLVMNETGVSPDGTKQNFGAPGTALFKRATDTLRYEGFCFLDDDGDGLRAVWHAKDASTLPSLNGGVGWEKISKDIFIPDADGFFKPVAGANGTVTANFAIGTNVDRSEKTTSKSQSATLTTNASVAIPDVCKIDMPTSLSASGCFLDAAFVSIFNGFDNGSDRLDYKGRVGLVGWVGDKSFTITGTDLPSLGAATVTGTWHSSLGVLSFMANGASLDVIDWRRLFADVELKTRGSSFTVEKTIRYHIGALAHIDNGTAHFHEFVPMGASYENYVGGVFTGYSIFPFNTAKALASAPTAKFCGLQPYLSTVTSAAESAVFDTMHKIKATPVGGGWMGGIYKFYPQQLWRWNAGPEMNEVFWQSSQVNGRPAYSDGTIEGNTSKYLTTGIDHLPNVAGNELQRYLKPKIASQDFRYSNFSFGLNPASCSGAECEPYSIGSADHYLTYQDNGSDAYLWHSAQDSRSTDMNYGLCGNTPGPQVCGYYREFGGMPGDPPNVTLAADVTVNIIKHRRLCAPES